MASRAGGAVIDAARASIFLAKADADCPDGELAALRSLTDGQLGITEDFVQAALASFGLEPTAVPQRLAVQGTFHRLFDVESPAGMPGLLRIAARGGEADSGLMDLECRVSQVLRAKGLPVPSCVYREVRSRGVHLVERARGTSLTAIDADEAAMLRALGKVGRFLAGLHVLRGTGFGPLSLTGLEEDPPRLRGLSPGWNDYLRLRLDEHLRRCVGQGAMTDDESWRALAHFESQRADLASSPSALLHGDPGSHNFIVENEEIVAVIDWEDALLGDPLFDLASLCTFHPERRHAAIIAGYGVELAVGTAPWNRFWLYFLRIALAKTVHRFRFGYTDRPGRPPASRRIQLALARLDGAR
jgi:Ser/Thr protein kinase RdoA (MazF antagonist)